MATGNESTWHEAADDFMEKLVAVNRTAKVVRAAASSASRR